jgi:hypothetical protein
MPPRPPPLRLAALAVAVLALAPAPAAGQLSPQATWRTFETEHFVVHYEEGLGALARRAAARAEVSRERLAGALVPPPRGRVHLVVADNWDTANGSATPFPRNRIVLYAHAPADEPSLAFAYDWLELLVAHELVHIHHLDHAAFPWGALRALLGRHPLTFPNATVPRWTTEGLATWLESWLTGAGRVHGTLHDMMLRTAVLEGRFFPIDRATGEPTSWPGGLTAYVYGSMFHDFLAERYGAEGAQRFVVEVGSRWNPYAVDAAARAAYGTSFTAAWRAWEAELRETYGRVEAELRAGGVTEPEVLTAAGRRVESPRWSPDGSRIAFAQATGREAPSTRVVHPDGSVEVLAPRTMTGPLSWRPDGSGLVTAQLDVVERNRLLSDLYSVSLDGTVRRLGRGERLLEPDVRAADGRIVAVRGGGAWNALVVLEEGGEPRTLVAPAEDVHWASPRWSPAGDRIAAARMTTGGGYGLVLLDTTGSVERELTADRALDLTPAWSPDGRFVLFSSDRTGIPNLHAVDVQTGALLQVTSVVTGAFQPDVSRDGRWIALLWYRADGYHVARIPYDPASWRSPPPLRDEAAAPPRAPGRYATGVGGPSRRYSALETLAPTAWSPLVEPDTLLGVSLGAAVAGIDVIGRHAYAASASIRPGRGSLDGSASYVYSGLGQPTLGVSALQEWRLVLRAGTRLGADTVPISTPLLLRERSASAVAGFAWPRFRSYAWLSAGVNLRRIHYAWLAPGLEPVRGVPQRVPDLGVVVNAGRSSGRLYDFSVSPEDGWTAAATVEGRRYVRALPGERAARGYLRTGGRVHGYQAVGGGGYARAVLAARGLAAADVGTRSPGFSAGGPLGGGLAGPLATGTGMGSVLRFPVRGYPAGTRFGDRALGGTLEARIPIALVERGHRLLPVYLDRLWGTAFADGASAWCSAECPLGLPRAPARPLLSAGAELGVDLRLLFHARADVMVGLAVPLTDAGAPVGRPAPGVYLRFGRMF